MTNEIEFSTSGPMISSSGDACEENRIYKLLKEKSGRRWVVAIQDAAAENIYADGGKGSQGMAGRTLTFDLEKGEKVSFIGPWKTSAKRLFEATGYDVRGLYYYQSIISLKRRGPDKIYGPYLHSEILHYDENPVLGDLDVVTDKAKKYANEYGQRVFISWRTKGGGCAGFENPSKEEKSND